MQPLEPIASTKYVVVEVMDGDVKVAPVAIAVPPVAVEYQWMVPPLVVADRSNVPALHLLLGMVPVMDANGLTDNACTAATLPQAFATVYEMPATPAATPVTTPEIPTVATAALPLLQVPPIEVSESVAAAAAQRVVAPLIGPATLAMFTVTAEAVTAAKLVQLPL